MDGLQEVIYDGGETVKRGEVSENYIEHQTRGSSKNLPNGCVKHSLDDNGLVKLRDIPSSGIESGSMDVKTKHEKKDSEKSSDEPESLNSPDNKYEDRTCDNLEASPMHTSQNPSECDMDSADMDSADLTASSDGVTDSVSTAISRVSISDTESSFRTDSESKPQRPLTYVVYESEEQMPDIMRLITKDLSEPYSIYTYRYFIHNWPKLCFLAMDEEKCVGAIVCKLDLHKKMVRRGYIAMLAVDENYRSRGIGSHLVMKAIRAMVSDDCDEVVLETEITNKAALRLYENLGFVRDKRLFRYYLNGVDALRLKLWLR